MNKEKILKLIIWTVLITGVVFVMLDHKLRIFITHPHLIKHYISNFHSSAPLVFVGLYVIRIFLLVFPAGVFTIASGALFGRTSGFVFAFILSMIGAFLSASLSFWLGKNLMSSFVQKHLTNRIKFLREDDTGHFKLIFYLRLIMIMPFDAFGYAVGAANIKYKDFILGTMLGIIPEFLGYTYLGYTGARRDISWEKKLIIYSSLLALILVGHFGKKVFERLKIKKTKKDEQN